MALYNPDDLTFEEGVRVVVMPCCAFGFDATHVQADGEYGPCPNCKAVPVRWKDGGKVEVLPGTTQAMSGPHPKIHHKDEVELLPEQRMLYLRSSDRDIMAQDIMDADIVYIDGVKVKDRHGSVN